MKCSICEEDNLPKARYCRSCGARLFIPKKRQGFCTLCGRNIAEKAVFCPDCGNKLETGETLTLVKFSKFFALPAFMLALGIVGVILILNRQQRVEKFPAEERTEESRVQERSGESVGQRKAGELPVQEPVYSDSLPRESQVDPQELYDRAYLDLTKGNYDLAITRFSNYVRSFPETEQASNAQYWLGDCYYAKENYTRAAIEFHKILENYSTSARVPSALYNLVRSLVELGSDEQAERYRRELMEKYPNTKEAKWVEEMWKSRDVEGEQRKKAIENMALESTKEGGSHEQAQEAKVQERTREAWVRTYNGPGNSVDKPSAMVVDGSGNVYVTGESFGGTTSADYTTIKYDPSGNELWVRRYNGPGNGDDRAFVIALDHSNNVYVTGSSYGNDTWDDYATIKYDPQGNELWVKRYNGPGNDFDKAIAIAIDGYNNVYVAGTSDGTGNQEDFAIIKYDQHGNELWVIRYDGIGIDCVKASAIDSYGHNSIYVTGTSDGGGESTDYLTIKCDENGNLVWVRRYSGPEKGSDWPCGITVDSYGNVCVAGTSEGAGTQADFATVKYDSQGNQLWARTYGDHDWDQANALVVDSSGNVYVTGHLTPYGYATIKYDPDGKELWVRTYRDQDEFADAEGITIDASGDVYVTGHSHSEETQYDYATIKYYPNGDTAWVRRYTGSGHYTDEASIIVADGVGNVYVTGASFEPGRDFDYVTIKYVQGK